MKQLLLSATLFLSIAANAQQIKLNKGQKITITSSLVQDIDMGIGQINNSTNSTSVLNIKDADNKNYNAVYTLSKLSISVDAMGQQDSYDSEKPEDKDKELGKSLGEKIGKEVNVTIDKTTGNAVAETPATPEKEEEQDNPFAGMKEMFGAADSEAGITQSAFFIIPAGKKAGDSWTDSVAVSDAMKGSKTYTIKSINGTEAVITVFSKMEGKQNIELQGMQIDIALSAKTEGELLVDTKTSLLKKSSRVADVTGNMDMMGQSMPITSKLTETTEYK